LNHLETRSGHIMNVATVATVHNYLIVSIHADLSVFIAVLVKNGSKRA
jgi:hypothetical protein